MVRDVKALCKVTLVFLPMPIYWALYDQQGSRWTEQAQNLNGRVGTFIIKPDQFLIFNPCFVLILVPVFDYLYSRFNLFKKPLQRVIIGFIFTSLAFAFASILEYNIQQASISLNHSHVKLINLSPCKLNLYNSNNRITNISQSIQLPKAFFKKNIEYKLSTKIIDEIFHGSNSTNFSIMCLNYSGNITNYLFQISDNNISKSLIFFHDETSNTINYHEYIFNTNNQIIGKSQIRFILFDKLNCTRRMGLVLKNDLVTYNNILISNFIYNEVDNSDYDLLVYDEFNQTILETKLSLEISSRYTIVIFESFQKKMDYIFITDIYPNGIHRFWQLIQIVTMAAGEIMVSITGLSFAYSQAPTNMKSVLQSLWLLTVAFGNILVAIIAESRITNNQVYEYLVYAFLLVIATIIFSFIIHFYEYEEDNINL